MRIDPRSSLAVQLIREAEFGPGRLDPQGPRLRLTPQETVRPLADVAERPVAVGGSRPVEAKPDPRPADTHRCDRRLPAPCPHLIYAAPPADVNVTRVIETTVLPSHLAGALLDVLA
ncbi:MAG: hypothetical protein AAGL98_03065 [Planctomycetota bacterium]